MLSKIQLNEGPFKKIELEVRIQVKDSPSPHRTIDWEEVAAFHELTISASIYRRSSQTARWRDSAFGQCRDEIRNHLNAGLLEEAQQQALAELLEIWGRWHLNGLNPGLRPQRDALRSKARTDPAVLEYGAACKFLETIDLLTTKHTKYTYGSAWLIELLPDDVIDRVRQLCKALGARVLEAA